MSFQTEYSAVSYTHLACGDDNNDDNSVPVESITLNHETLTLKSGATETLVPTIDPDRVTAESVVWSSDKTSVATVSKDGLVLSLIHILLCLLPGRSQHTHYHCPYHGVVGLRAPPVIRFYICLLYTSRCV